MRSPLLRWLLPGLTLLPALASAQLSASKLSAHLINNYTVGSSNIVSGHPRVLKVLGLDSGFPSGMVQAMRDYKTKVPGGIVVVRIYSPKNYSLADDPTASAHDFWTNILQQGLSYLSPSDRGLIDYLEGPNEGQTPTLGYPNTTAGEALQASQWFNQFWTNLTPYIAAVGYKPCIGSIAVGNPGGSQAEMQSYLDAFVPALRQAQAAGGAWSYHAYTINYTTDLATEIWYSLRYRQFYSYFAGAYPDLASIPMILTEGGVDQSGNPSTSGWQARGPADWYQRWLNWFDGQLQQDSYIPGCTLFENGDATGWPSFELEPLAGWMRAYLTGPTAIPAAPTSVAAVAGNGTVTLTWTNLPLSPTTWSVKRGTNSSGPFFTIATNVTTGVVTTGFVDSAIRNGVTYYYVVTALNAVGQSDPSAPVSATPLPPSYLAINAGGPALGSYAADAYFDFGTAYATSTVIATNGLINPAPMAVYQSQRYGNLTYTFGFLAPATSYKLRLHFAEVFWTAAGQRVFNVFINGTQVLTNFDIFQAAGGSYKGIIEEFNAVSDLTGTITIQLATVVDNASINGIEILANPATTIPAAPSNLRATVGNALVGLAWSAPAGATGFSVKRSLTSGGNYSVVASNLTQTSYRDPSFTPNTTYYYVVSALNTFGESPNSNQVSAQPTNGLPDLVVTSASWTPTSLYSGSHAVFSARVLNRGSAATPAGTILGVGFNVDNTGTASWSGSYQSSLAPNTAVTLTADSGPSGVNYWNATTGPHTVVATVDDVNRIPESIEDNNALAVPFTVYAGGYAINSGGGAVGAFAADANFAGSANTFSVTNAVDTSSASNPAPAAVYQSERWGEVAYVFGNLVPGSNYTVRLHFAEISPSSSNVGDRRFNVWLNGIRVFADLDILAATGAKFRAITFDIKKRADPSGTLLVQFTRGSANEPKCSGLQVFGSAPPSQSPRIISLGVTNQVLSLTWQTTPAVMYQLQYAPDLAPPAWTLVSGIMLSSGSSLSTNTPAGSSRGFYRVLQLN